MLIHASFKSCIISNPLQPPDRSLAHCGIQRSVDQTPELGNMVGFFVVVIYVYYQPYQLLFAFFRMCAHSIHKLPQKLPQRCRNFIYEINSILSHFPSTTSKSFVSFIEEHKVVDPGLSVSSAISLTKHHSYQSQIMFK